MFECANASCSFIFFGKFTPQTKTNERQSTLTYGIFTEWFHKFVAAVC